MSKKLCGTCAHWKRYTDDFDAGFYGKAGKCGSKKFVYDPPDNKTPRDGLQYWDYEGYSAGFNTGEAFGCIHWSPVAAQPEREDR